MKAEDPGPACGALRGPGPPAEAEFEWGPSWGQGEGGLPGAPQGHWVKQTLRFRDFCFRGARDPQETCGRIQALCRQWLRPEEHSKDRMLDLVVLEQFLKVMPPEMEAWVRGRAPQSSAHAVALAQAFILSPKPQPQVGEALLEVKAEPTDKTESLQEDEQEAASPGEDMEVGDHKPAAKLPPRLACLQGGIDTLDAPGNQNPVTIKKEPESSAAEESCRGVVGGSALLMEAVEEGLESVAPPGKVDSKEKSKTCKNPKETVVKNQGWDRDATYISPEGTYLPQTPFPEGIPKGKKRTQPKLSEFEKNFLQQLFRAEDEEGPAGASAAHRCLECGKTFNFSAKLKLHQRFHSEEKPFECAECGRHFRHNANLQTHRRMHTRDKPFRCEKCGRCFIYSWAHKKHQRFHEVRSFGLEGIRQAAEGGAAQADLPPSARQPNEAEELTHRWSEPAGS